MPRQINGEKMLNIKEVAALLEVNYRTVQRYIAAKEFQAFKIGNKWWVAEATIKAYIAKRSNIVEVPAA